MLLYMRIGIVLYAAQAVAGFGSSLEPPFFFSPEMSKSHHIASQKSYSSAKVVSYNSSDGSVFVVRMM